MRYKSNHFPKENFEKAQIVLRTFLKTSQIAFKRFNILE